MRPGIDPKIDYAFKRLFGREQNITLLMHLLNAILRRAPGGQVVELQLLNPFNDKDALDDKLSILDLKARDARGRQFNVEMQMLPDVYFPKRVTYYLTRLHQGQLHEGEGYSALQPTFAICFLNGESWPQVPDYHLTFRLLEERHGFAFTDDLEVHILELPKFTKTAEELTDPLDIWLYFLRHAQTLDTDTLPAPLQTPEIQHAMGELIMLTQSELERERYEARVKWQRDERSRLASALEEGLQKGVAIGEVVGQIHLCERILGRPLTPGDQLLSLTPDERAQFAAELEAQLAQQLTQRARASGDLAEPPK